MATRGEPRQFLPELQSRREEIAVALRALQHLSGLEHQALRAARLQRLVDLVPAHRRGGGGALAGAPGSRSNTIIVGCSSFGARESDGCSSSAARFAAHTSVGRSLASV